MAVSDLHRSPPLTPRYFDPEVYGHRYHAARAHPAPGPPPAKPPLPLLALDEELFSSGSAQPYVAYQAAHVAGGAVVRDLAPGAHGFIESPQLAEAYRRVSGGAQGCICV